MPAITSRKVIASSGCFYWLDLKRSDCASRFIRSTGYRNVIGKKTNLNSSCIPLLISPPKVTKNKLIYLPAKAPNNITINYISTKFSCASVYNKHQTVVLLDKIDFFRSLSLIVYGKYRLIIYLPSFWGPKLRFEMKSSVSFSCPPILAAIYPLYEKNIVNLLHTIKPPKNRFFSSICLLGNILHYPR
jgi:hypothetical protein